jgi:siroheme synthase-like protein
MSLLYPIFLDISQRSILIVGGGTVAARKAAGVLTAGATRVRAVAPKFVKDFPATVQMISESFAPTHIGDATIIFAATDSAQANEAVVAEAHQRGILVNRADVEDDHPGDFTLPAVLRAGSITVAVSTGGSPALAARLRDALAGSITDSWVNLAQASRDFRPRIKSAGLPIARRKEIFSLLASEQAMSKLDQSGANGLWEWICVQFPELRNKT